MERSHRYIQEGGYWMDGWIVVVSFLFFLFVPEGYVEELNMFREVDG